jgi:hypothetical protein
MKETLAEALSALFTEANAASATPGVATEITGASPAENRAQEALDRYNRAMEQLRSGDWTGFGKEIDAMRGILEKMSRQSTGH